MKTKQIFFDTSSTIDFNKLGLNPNLILVFSNRELLQESNIGQEIRQAFPQAILAGCSTAGEIGQSMVKENTASISFIEFEKTEIIYREHQINDAADSLSSGATLIESLPQENLKHVFVLSDGLNINGSQLVIGMRDKLGDHCKITGGLAGDGANFEETLLLNNEGELKNKSVIALGFYGNHLEIGYGSMGGWNSFGIERLVTRSTNNILYELDGKPALELYKSFLGDQAQNLPASGLLFPLSVRSESDKPPLVRTILGISEEDQSLTFAGDVPTGSYVRLMKANIDRLIDGAEEAAQIAKVDENSLAILISCVGRKLVLKQLVEEEVESVQGVLGTKCTLTGFYSYGEIAPFKKDATCELHNQTMTITTFREN
tara:strand:- start:2387 stop:3508 length:1122 start_codon:yes stop_codon:yes gene_type:complete